MANQDLTKDTVSFSKWHKELHKIALSQNGSAADQEAWREDYEAGKTPRQAWEDEWGWED